MAAKIGGKYLSTEALLRGEFPDDPGLGEEFFETHGQERIANTLWMMRTHHGVTQEELARRMGVSQSKIAKLEDRGGNVKFNDVLSYARALGYNTSLQFAQGDTGQSWCL